MSKTYNDGIKDAGYALDELFSMDSNEISRLFDGYTDAKSVIDNNSIVDIIEIINEAYTPKDTPKNTLVYSTSGVADKKAVSDSTIVPQNRGIIYEKDDEHKSLYEALQGVDTNNLPKEFYSSHEGLNASTSGASGNSYDVDEDKFENTGINTALDENNCYITHHMNWHLRRAEHLSDEEMDSLIAEGRHWGIMISFDRSFSDKKKGINKWIGHIAMRYKDEWRNVWIESEDRHIENNGERRPWAGEIVEFDLEKSEKWPLAKNMTFLKYAAPHIDLNLNPREEITNHRITSFGRRNLIGRMINDTGKSLRDLKLWMLDKGYTYEDFDYIYICAGNSTYRASLETSPLNTDIKVKDLEEYMQWLDEVIYGIVDHKNLLTKELYNAEKKKADEMKRAQIEADKLVQKMITEGVAKDKQIREHKARGIIQVIIAEIMELGFTKNRAEEIAKSHISVRSAAKNRNNILYDGVNVAKALAKEWTSSNKIQKNIKGRKTPPDMQAIFHLKVKGYVQYFVGESQSRVSQLIGVYGLEDKLQNDSISVTDDPLEIAKKIVEEGEKTEKIEAA